MKNGKKTNQNKKDLAVKKSKNIVTNKKVQKTKKVNKKAESSSSESSSEEQKTREIAKNAVEVSTSSEEEKTKKEIESVVETSTSSEEEKAQEINKNEKLKVDNKDSETSSSESSSESKKEIETESSSESNSDSSSEEKLVVKPNDEDSSSTEKKESSSSSEVEEVSSSVDAETLESKDRRVVFIKGLPFNLTEDKLKKEMDLIGKSVRVAIPVTGDGDRNKGFAFVEFVKEKDAEKCLKLDGKELFGRQIAVNMANTGERKKKYTVKVNNLPYKCTKDDLMEFFSQFGDIKGCHLPIDEEKRSKGFAFVFVEHEEVFNKILKNKKKFMDRTLFCKNADQKDSGDKYDIRKRNISDEINTKRSNQNKGDMKKNNRGDIKKGKDNKQREYKNKGDSRKKGNTNKIVFDSDSE